MDAARAADDQLGEFLISRGWVTRRHLRRAERAQQLVGDRLGTCLLEMDVVTEDLLLAALSKLHGLSSANADDLRGIPAEVTDLVPAKLAARTRTVPFRVVGSELSVAMDDPGDLAAQDEIAFATGKRLRVHITSEVRICEALERYYDHPCPDRLGHLADRLNRSRYLWEPEERRWAVHAGDERPGPGILEPPPLPPGLVPVEKPAAPAAVATTPPRRQPPLPRVIPLSREERAQLGEEVAPVTLAELEQRLEEAADLEQVGAALLAYLGQGFRRTVLFKVGADWIAGWSGQGDELDLHSVERFSADFTTPSVFLNLKQGAGLHLGPLIPVPVHRALARCWGGELGQECVLLPVRLKDRLVAVIYGDRGDTGVAGLDLGELRHLAALTAAAFERYVRRKKSRKAQGL